MKEPKSTLPDPADDDPRRRLGLTIRSSEDELPEPTRKDRVKIWLSGIGAIALLLMLGFMMFADTVENFQCSPWKYITFQCDRFDAKFKPWDTDAQQSAK